MRSAAELAYRRSNTFRRSQRRGALDRIWFLMMAVGGFAAGVIVALH